MPQNIDRRKFMKNIGAAGVGAVILPQLGNKVFAQSAVSAGSGKAGTIPLVISTWDHGLAANEAAYEILKAGGNALDAVEKGVNVPENDPNVMSVGYGGLPDEDGHVTLDSCIMDKNGDAGSVAFLQGYKNAISIARKVMEKTRHVMLVGEGAEAFAAAQGFIKQEMLTEEAKRRWEEWKKKQASMKEKENHDTIGMVALDAMNDIAGACTTSGLAWKIHGRVGDSPIIGAGMYVDNEVGGAASTGVGEECIKVNGSFLVVETMRHGASPEEACMEAVKRIAKRHKEKPEFQIAFLALNKKGEYGGFSLNKGFEYAVLFNGENKLLKSGSLY